MQRLRFRRCARHRGSRRRRSKQPGCCGFFTPRAGNALLPGGRLCLRHHRRRHRRDGPRRTHAGQHTEAGNRTSHQQPGGNFPAGGMPCRRTVGNVNRMSDRSFPSISPPAISAAQNHRPAVPRSLPPSLAARYGASPLPPPAAAWCAAAPARVYSACTRWAVAAQHGGDFVILQFGKVARGERFPVGQRQAVEQLEAAYHRRRRWEGRGYPGNCQRAAPVRDARGGGSGISSVRW